jgi:hypothetical protein
MPVITQPGADGIYAVGAGAPADKIEVTPAMVVAGVAALVNFEGEVSRAFLAKEVFQAMAAVAHTETNRWKELNPSKSD